MAPMIVLVNSANETLPFITEHTVKDTHARHGLDDDSRFLAGPSASLPTLLIIILLYMQFGGGGFNGNPTNVVPNGHGR